MTCSRRELSGLQDASGTVLSAASDATITVPIEADYIVDPGVIIYMFPVTEASIKSGKYSSTQNQARRQERSRDIVSA